MTTLPRLITDAEELREGDIVRLSKDGTTVQGPLERRHGDLRLPGISITPRARLDLGWTVELISRPVPEPAEGLYVWRDMVADDGQISTSARIVKWRGYWTDAAGGADTRGARRAWEEGKLFGPLKVQVS